MRGFIMMMAVLAAMTAGAAPARAQTAAPATDAPTAPAPTPASAPAASTPPPAAAPAPSAPLPHSSAPAQSAAPRKSGGPLASSTNPYTQKVVAMARALAHELSDSQVNALALVRRGFGEIRAVRNVQGDVGNAAKACASDNPDLKVDMANRFGRWQQALTPLLMQDEKDMNQVIRSGIAGDRKKIEEYLSMIDKSALYADGHIDKRPVTTPKACRALMDSMDRTQGALVDVLKTIKWPQADSPMPPAARQVLKNGAATTAPPAAPAATPAPAAPAK